MRGAGRVASRLALATSTVFRRVSGLANWAGARFSRELDLDWEGLGHSAEPEADAVAERPQRKLAWTSRLLLVAAVAVPLLLLTLAAWQNFRLVQLEAEQRVTIETGQLHEHALSAIETYPVILAWIEDRIRGLDWDRIEHDGELHRFLSNLETLPPSGAVLVVDPQGQLRASGSPYPAAAADLSNRDAFVAQRDRDARIFVGREHVDQLTRLSDFDISRRRSTPDERFDGVIIISANPGYFANFFSTISRDENFSALLLRNDGSVLVRFPPLPSPRVFSPEAPVMRAIAAEPDRGLFWGKGGIDGIKRLFGYQRIGEYPLYVAFGIPMQARVEMALATVERGERLTSQLLAFARRQPLAVARLDLNDTLRQMAELMARTVGSTVRVESDFSPDLWPVDADATQLELAVINLAINSRDAMPDGGVLRVRTFKTTLPEGVLGEAGDFVGLEISDTGTVMSADILARAFEPFFTSKGPGKGTGLGLSLVYGFARQSGGSASIRSEVGRGTAVTLLLPRAGEAGTGDEPEVISLPSDASA